MARKIPGVSYFSDRRAEKELREIRRKLGKGEDSSFYSRVKQKAGNFGDKHGETIDKVLTGQ
jgi:hypothetical protein